MPTLKNGKREIFAQEIAKGAKGRDAYRAAGFNAKTDGSADTGASRLLKVDEVAARVVELRERAAEKAEITIESLIAEADELKDKAAKDGKWAAAVTALTLKARLSGNLVDKGKVEHTGPDGAPLPEGGSVVIFALPDNGRDKPG